MGEPKRLVRGRRRQPRLCFSVCFAAAKKARKSHACSGIHRNRMHRDWMRRRHKDRSRHTEGHLYSHGHSYSRERLIGIPDGRECPHQNPVGECSDSKPIIAQRQERLSVCEKALSASGHDLACGQPGGKCRSGHRASAIQLSSVAAMVRGLLGFFLNRIKSARKWLLACLVSRKVRLPDVSLRWLGGKDRIKPE